MKLVSFAIAHKFQLKVSTCNGGFTFFAILWFICSHLWKFLQLCAFEEAPDTYYSLFRLADHFHLTFHFPVLGSFPHRSWLQLQLMKKTFCAMAKFIHKNIRFTRSATFIVTFIAMLSCYEVSLRVLSLLTDREDTCVLSVLYTY